MANKVCHTLRGCVDWNLSSVDMVLLLLSHPSWVCGLKQYDVFAMAFEYLVTPFVGVWIETYLCSMKKEIIKSHTLRGCVDWNKRI